MSHILLDGVSCAPSQNSVLFPPFTASIADEVVGLFGRNGSGKSSLLRAIAGEVSLRSGSITLDGRAALMRQSAFAPGITVGEALGARQGLERLARIESGAGSEDDFETADWSLPARLERALEQVGLSEGWLERTVDGLSGGERCRVKLAQCLLSEPDILLLDEPTNDLDDKGRRVVAELLAGWNGPALVATHDRALLERMDRIIELSPAGVLSVSGGWGEFVRQRDAERERAKHALDQAQAAAKQARAARQSRHERQNQRASQGRNAAARRDDSKLEINARKGQAERTSARNTRLGDEQVEMANAALEHARQEVERIIPVRIELPPSGLLPSRRLISADAITCRYGKRTLFGPLSLSVTGPQRIAITGENGSGKTSLLRIICGEIAPAAGTIEAETERFAVLDQHLSLLNAQETAIEAMQRHNPQANAHECHAALARFGFRGAWGDRLVGTLSGGERVRLALACLFSGTTPPSLLILDEPTNHLDIYAIELLEEALRGFDGAILCVSHDAAFREALDLTKSWDFGAGEA